MHRRLGFAPDMHRCLGCRVCAGHVPSGVRLCGGTGALLLNLNPKTLYPSPRRRAGDRGRLPCVRARVAAGQGAEP
jgi:hypothetical protein